MIEKEMRRLRELVCKGRDGEPRVDNISIEDIDMNSDLEGIGMDSLDKLEFIMDVEKEFNILSIKDEDIEKIKCLQDVVDYLNSSKIIKKSI